MNLNTEVRNGVVVIELAGDVMGGPEAIKLKDKINQLLDESLLKVVIDLSGVDRMNSSGLGILINALTTFKQNDGDLKLGGTTELIQNLLKITKLDNLFESYETVDSAVNSFGNEGI